MLTINEITKYLTLTGKELTAQEEETLNSVFAEVDTQNADGEEVVNQQGKKGDGALNNKELNLFKNKIRTKASNLFQNIRFFLNKVGMDFGLKNEALNGKESFDYFATNKNFEYEKFTLEALQKAFPDCEVSTFDDKIEVINSNGDLMLRVFGYGLTDSVCYFVNNERVELTYRAEELYSKRYSGSKIKILYCEGKKILIENEKQGIKYELDENENIATAYDRHSEMITKYENNQITSVIDLKTGKKTKFLTNGKIEETFDGKVLAELSLNKEIDVDFIKNLSEKEQLAFLENFKFDNTEWCFCNNSEIEKIYDISINLLKEIGSNTKDLEELHRLVLEKNANVDFEENANAEISFAESFRTHIVARANSLMNPKENIVIKEPNGSIDADFKQGNMGDCWLLSTIKTLAEHPKGLEKLNDLITIQKDSDKLIAVSVKIQGKDYVISSEELHSSIEYSTGDLDVRAIEIAVNRFCLENGYQDVAAGATVDFGLEIFLGNLETIENSRNSFSETSNNIINSSFIEELKTNTRIGVLGVAYPHKSAIDVETGEYIELIQKHAYSILYSDDVFVYIVNPHDSSKTLKIEMDKLSRAFCYGKLYNI